MDVIEKSRNKNLSRLGTLFDQYGEDERSLGWTKHKQVIRFKQMFNSLETDGADILDVGCGFGDLYTFLKSQYKEGSFNYTGLDLMPEFIEIAKKNNPGIDFINQDFFNWDTDKRFKYVVECGCFTNLDPKAEDDSYEFIDSFIARALALCTDDGAAVFHFLTDKVDYRTSEDDFHINPERILKLAYKHSRRVVLDNSVFPFEACLTIYKDDSFSKEITVFNKVM